MVRRLTHHLVTSTNENCHCASVGTLLNNQHLLSRGSEAHLADNTSCAELVRGQVLEAGHNTAVCGNGDQLNLRPTNPTNGRQVILEQKVVGLIIETPLADDQVGTRLLQLLDHLCELLLLVVLQLLEFLNRCDIKLVLGLGLGRLKGTGQDGQFGIPNFVGHLGVREVLVHDNTSDKQRVLEGSTDLAVNLDQLEVDILALKVGNREHGINGDLGELVVGLGDAMKTVSINENAYTARNSYILLPRLVLATLRRLVVSSWLNVISSLILSSSAIAISQAWSYPSAIRMGWMPLSMRSEACSSMAAASTTTPVVPSPISSS